MDELSQDFDLFWGQLDQTEPETDVVEEDLFGWALDSEPTPEEETVDEGTDLEAEPTEEAPVAEAEPTETVDEVTDAEELDADAIIQELLWQQAEVDDKVEEIKDEAENTGNSELLWMIDELQSLLIEKNQLIDELTKKDEITSSKLMDKYWDAENYSFYKDTIDALENNPKLNMLVKYIDSDNEKMQDRVINILSDLLTERTGEDISALINSNQKSAVSNALTDVNGWGEVAAPAIEEEDKPLTYDESINNLF